MSDGSPFYQGLVAKRSKLRKLFDVLTELAKNSSVDILLNGDLDITGYRIPKSKDDPNQSIAVRFKCNGEPYTLTMESPRTSKYTITGPALTDFKPGTAINHRRPADEPPVEEKKMKPGERGRRKALRDDAEDPKPVDEEGPFHDYHAIANAIVGNK